MTSWTRDLRAKASELVTRALEQADDRLSNREVRLLVDALEHDLGTACDKAALDENRLTNVETQTRVLSEAVVAITKTADTLAPACSP